MDFKEILLETLAEDADVRNAVLRIVADDIRKNGRLAQLLIPPHESDVIQRLSEASFARSDAQMGPSL